MMAIGKSGISICCVNNRDPSASLICYNARHGNALRRLAQYQLYSQEHQALQLSRLLVKHKLRKQAQLLDQLASDIPAHRFQLLKSAKEIRQLSIECQQAINTAQLMGYEGAGGKQFFDVYTSLFAESWGFNARNRRPPKDPVNAILSLTYALIHYEAVRACLALGLETQIGVLHRISYNRDSLACDLLELFRPLINSWVLNLFKNANFKPSHFKLEQQACFLNKEGSQVFYPLFHAQNLIWRKMLRQYSCNYARYLDKLARRSSL